MSGEGGLVKKICVIGLGYIGLPTAAVLASNNFKVIGVDIDDKVVSTVNKGAIHIHEQGLSDIVKSAVDRKSLTAKSHPEEADAFIIAVPTPNNIDKSCDLSYVITAVQSILPYLTTGNLVILESTVEPLTTNSIVKPMIESKGFAVGSDVHLAFCPERVLPGKILYEIINNDRVIGGCTPNCAEKAAEIYREFVKGKIFITDASTAEMAKLMENTFRDVNIAYANELVKICSKLNINALEAIALANRHPRVNILQPGPGVGGHCIAVDPYFIASKAPELAKLILTSRQINCEMPHYIFSKVKELVAGICLPKIAVFGITYKGNIGDIRESPALEIIQLLKDEGFTVNIYDPYVEYEGMELTNLKEAVKNADLILILTDHNEFKDIDYYEIAGQMRTAVVFDTKNIIDVKKYDKSLITCLNLGNIFMNR